MTAKSAKRRPTVRRASVDPGATSVTVHPRERRPSIISRMCVSAAKPPTVWDKVMYNSRDAGVRREANFTVLFRANRGISDSGGSIPHPDSHRRRDRDWRRNRFVGTADTLSNRTEGDV